MVLKEAIGSGCNTCGTLSCVTAVQLSLTLVHPLYYYFLHDKLVGKKEDALFVLLDQ